MFTNEPTQLFITFTTSEQATKHLNHISAHLPNKPSDLLRSSIKRFVAKEYEFKTNDDRDNELS